MGHDHPGSQDPRGPGGTRSGTAAAQVPSAQVPANGVDDSELSQQIGAIILRQGYTAEERLMMDARVVERTLISNRGINDTRRVLFDGGPGSEPVAGYHKGFTCLNDGLARSFGQQSRQQPIHEVAAWRLAAELGPPWSQLVPPCVLRTVEGILGSVSRERIGRPMKRRPSLDDQVRAAGFFDAVIGQQDRHAGNALKTSAGDLVLIDHGFVFARPGDARNASVFLGMRLAEPRASELTEQERGALSTLVHSEDLLGMQAMLEPDRADALRQRAEGMLETGQIARAL